LIERGFTQKTILNKREALNRLETFLGNLELSFKSSLEYMKHLHKNGWQTNSIKAEFKIIKAFISYLFNQEKVDAKDGR